MGRAVSQEQESRPCGAEYKFGHEGLRYRPQPYFGQDRSPYPEEVRRTRRALRPTLLPCLGHDQGRTQDDAACERHTLALHGRESQ
jgi:hypothetical protein